MPARPALRSVEDARGSDRDSEKRASGPRTSSSRGLVLNMEAEMATQDPAPLMRRPDFSGLWKCTEVDGDWNRFLLALEMTSLQRSLAFGSGYGKGALQRIQTPALWENGKPRDEKETLGFTITNYKLALGASGWGESAKAPPREQSSFELRLDGSEQDIGMGNGSRWTLRWESMSIVARSTVGGKPCVIRRSLNEIEHAMVVKILYEDFFASRTFKRCDASGQLIDYYDID